jgi:hypothetical protein
MSGCGSGEWNSTVFNDGVRSEQGNPDFAGYPTCSSSSVQREDYGTKLVRFYEDSTFVSTAAAEGDPGHRFTPASVEQMVQCGVNLFGLDQADPNDPRLAAMVWSWAENEPRASTTGACAYDGGDDRFHSALCSGPAGHFACVDRTGAWFVSRKTGRPVAGAKVCAAERSGARFAVPGSGAHAQQLREAKAAAGVSAAWLAYSASNGTWTGTAR